MAKRSVHSWDTNLTAAQNAKRHLPVLVSDYFETGRNLMKGKPAPKDLHRFRLATKHLRTTLEIFRPCYGKSMEIRIDHLRGVQNRLGEINDCATTLALLKPSAKYKNIVASLNKRAAERTVAFHQYWHQTFAPPQQESRWRRYFSSFAREESTLHKKRRS
jgi:CHAD domain-containing protein